MSSIFISYRRSDSEFVVGRLYDKLAERFGEENIFKDVDSISLGEDFRESIDEALQSCLVFILVIGATWVNSTDEHGNVRLFNSEDYVRIELETALSEKVHIIPVLIGNTVMPKIEKLPDSIRKLVSFNAAKLRPDPDFMVDIQRLNLAIATLFKKKNHNVADKNPRKFEIFDTILKEVDSLSEKYEGGEVMRVKIRGAWRVIAIFMAVIAFSYLSDLMFDRGSFFNSLEGHIFIGFTIVYAFIFFVHTNRLIRSHRSAYYVKKRANGLEEQFKEYLGKGDVEDAELEEFLLQAKYHLSNTNN